MSFVSRLQGRQILEMLTDDRVFILKEAVMHLDMESAHYAGFVRFSELGGVLVSVIEPKTACCLCCRSIFATDS